MSGKEIIYCKVGYPLIFKYIFMLESFSFNVMNLGFMGMYGYVYYICVSVNVSSSYDFDTENENLIYKTNKFNSIFGYR